MKLLTKTTLYFLLVMILLLAAAGYYLFNSFSNEINERSDKELISDEIEWIQYIQTQEDAGTSVILKAPDLSIYPTDAAAKEYPAITDVNSYSAKINSTIPYRQLTQVVLINDVAYQIIIRQSQEQKAALVSNVTRIMLFVFTGLFIATIIFNWAISKQLWKPFRRSLNKIRGAELQKMEAMHFEQTNTYEFNELNTSLNMMTEKIYKDYINMKEFTENAAHEMQTPIAVVQSKLELLLQDVNLNDEQIKSLVHSTTALSRLSKLNQGLLLLAKIDNNQYEAKEAININEVIKKYLLFFDAFIKDKQLKIITDYKQNFFVKLHPLLADSLIANLLGNAVKYNQQEGLIHIVTDEKYFSISNTSSQPQIKPDKIFTRMSKHENNDEQSNGLGLSIVKKIADNNYLRVDYNVMDEMHNFIVNKI